ncbi:MAG: CarD family transcriptional regulator [Butyrivibrio sp.]|nr:CarD family transcriptional regulator [Butyrivibrio sp.]
MLNKGDCVVYGSHGLCKVRDILVPPFLERGKEKLYYLMVSVTDINGSLYVPVEGAEDKMREVIGADDAEGLIDELDGLEIVELPIGKKAEGVILELIKKNITSDMMRLVKTLRRIKAVREMEGKKFASMDEKYLGIAEKLLYNELAYSLDSDPTIVKDRILDELSQLPLETA